VMLRIKPAYLAAIEQGRTDELPGPAYAIGFIRAYADFLGLDAEQVLARFKDEASGVTARPDLALPVPLGERSLPGRGLVLVALILALCGYGVWYYLSTEDRNRPERVAAVPAALQVPSPAPALTVPPAGGSQDNNPMFSAAGSTSAAASVPSAPAASPTTDLSPASVVALAPAAAPLPAPVAPSQPAAAQPPSPTPTQAPGAALPASTTRPVAPTVTPAAIQPAGQTAGATPNATSKVSIKALTDCWIQIRGADQSIVFSRVLKSGETYPVPSRPGLSLRTGNAGALEIAVDGKPVPSIGAIGMLRRDVALDPAELSAGTAVHG
jgi:cytoskeleton protein RodZ